jgi:alpha-glucosidase
MRRFLFLFAALVFLARAQAKTGTVVSDTISGVPCRVYIPDGGKRYPVLYLQHGMWGNEHDWIDQGRLIAILDSLLALDAIEERVIVMPDNCPSRPTSEEEMANATSGEWERHFAAFMTEAEAKYPIDPNPATRAIAGLSMGGYHTMRVAHLMDGQFAYVGMFSPATFVHNYAPSAKIYWIAIGKDDFLYQSLTDYRQWLDTNGHAYTYYESEGGHTWPNWQDYIIRFLQMISPKQAVSSPDGQTTVRFRLSEAGVPQYAVTQDGEPVIAWSDMGFETTGTNTKDGWFFAGCERTSSDNQWETVWGEERLITDKHNELTLHLQQAQGTKMDIRFRAFDDGFAFRYLFPEPDPQRVITDERTEYRFVADPQAWSIPWRTEYYEGLWTKAPLSAKTDTLCSPVTLEMPNGRYAFVHEAALTDYPAQNLFMQDGALRTYLTPWLLGGETTPIKAYIPKTFATPWRMVILARDLKTMVASRIMLNLNEPCAIEDPSWIKPMKFIGIWWGMHMKSMTWEQGPIHGATTANMEHYLRFAKDHHIRAVLAEGWNIGWEDWKHFSFTEPYDDWDMDYLSALADSLGVQIVGHNETGGNAADYENQLDDAYAYHQAHGIHAIKTGYVAPIIRTADGLQWNKGQSGVRHYRKIIETAAKYHIAIDNHEPVMPTGLQRTWPNLMSQEGVRGQEWNAWSRDGGSPACHVTVLPFTRIMAGPVDYTPGVFAFENPVMPRTRVHSTLMNQLGLFVCFYSPLQMACDLPENYMKHPDAFRFIEEVPCDWERSELVDGQIGEYCVFARQERGGADWFIGGINADETRTVMIPLTMLEPGKKYKATIYRDGKKADWQTNPYDYIIETKNVKAGQNLSIRMASGGGFAIAIHEK